MSFSSTLSKSGSTGTLAQTGYGTKTGIAMQNGKWITDVGVFDVVGGVGGGGERETSAANGVVLQSVCLFVTVGGDVRAHCMSSRVSALPHVSCSWVPG